MYGEELHAIDRTHMAATETTAVVVEATGVILTREMILPGSVVYWGYRPTVAFGYTTGITAQGYLELYRNTRKIQTAVIGNAGGLGYAVGDLLSVTSAIAGQGSGAILRVKTITALTGAILTVEIVDPGKNYIGAANLATVALNGAGNNAFTVTITEKKVIDTIALLDGAIANKLYMRRVPNAIPDASPSGSPPASFCAGEELAIAVAVQAASTGQIVGDFQPLLVIQHRAENFAGQVLWVPGGIGVAVSPAVPNY